jgi:hypothetical protein
MRDDYTLCSQFGQTRINFQTKAHHGLISPPGGLMNALILAGLILIVNT